jgi:hypothetical protein
VNVGRRLVAIVAGLACGDNYGGAVENLVPIVRGGEIA